MTIECDICGRQEGAEVDIAGFPDGVPLGPIEVCETCGRHACPVCMNEVDCCFAEAAEHAHEPEWAPKGWARSKEPATHGVREYVRIN